MLSHQRHASRSSGNDVGGVERFLKMNCDRMNEGSGPGYDGEERARVQLLVPRRACMETLHQGLRQFFIYARVDRTKVQAW